MAKNKPRRIVVFLLFKFSSFFIFILPIRFALKVGGILGIICFYLLKKEKRKALDHLEIAFGNSKSTREKYLIARRVFENLGKSLVEIVSLSKFNKSNIDRYVEVKGIEAVDSLIKQGRSAIMVSAHFGNWELLAHYFAIKGYKVNVIARRVRMEQFENFLADIRKRHGLNILYRDASAREVIELLKKNEFVGIMPDQDMDSVAGVFVDFFGKKAHTPNGPAILNFLTKTPIIPCFIRRKKFGHQILVGNQIELSSTGDREKDVLKNTQIYTKIIEDYIRRFPPEWVWFHDRWKTRP